MPVPYMGSKRVSAPEIVNLIRAYCPEATDLYDVFCGGFAISEWAIKKGWKVHASDLNESVVALINEVLFGECLDPKNGENVFEHPSFIDRQIFFEYIKRNDWWGGYMKCIWSFGNNNRSYLFGQDIEPMKKLGHELVVDCKVSKDLPIPLIIQNKIIRLPDWHVRRMALKKYLAANKKRGELEQLQRLQRLQQLQRLEQLQQLQQLERLQCKSYDEVDIPAGAVIYCDPPYRNTAGYSANSESGFDHEEFYNWCREKSKTNPVFVSEYWMPEDFDKIFEFSRRQTLSSSCGGQTKHNEKVYFMDRTKYVDVIIKRGENFTGEKAVKVNGD